MIILLIIPSVIEAHTKDINTEHIKSKYIQLLNITKHI